jgi:hypothetical protein
MFIPYLQKENLLYMYSRKLDDSVNVFFYLVLVSKHNKIGQFVFLVHQIKIDFALLYLKAFNNPINFKIYLPYEINHNCSTLPFWHECFLKNLCQTLKNYLLFVPKF